MAFSCLIPTLNVGFLALMLVTSLCRRFLQKHLAQIKYLLPEAIDLEYVRSYDSDTRSNRWELKVSLLPMPAETEEPSREGETNLKKPKIETVQRRRAFHARLAKFASTHSEVLGLSANLVC